VKCTVAVPAQFVDVFVKNYGEEPSNIKESRLLKPIIAK
jgi:hypothetical protein